MKALVHDEYGGPEVLRIDELPIPQPGPDEVLVRVRAASINEWDAGLMAGTPLANRTSGLRRPARRTLGCDVAGVVEAIGPSVAGLRPGDAVFGDLSGCGFGAFAEYACVPESALAPKPDFLSWEQAATVPQAGGLAIAGLRKGGPPAGTHVLMNGGGGGVGTFAIQVAKALGAQVTGVDGPGKLDAMRQLGADDVLDCTSTDFTDQGEQYDLIVDVVCQRSVGAYRRALRKGGTAAVLGGPTRRLASAALLGLAGDKRVRVVIHRPNSPDDVALLVRLMAEGSVTPVVDWVYPLDEGRAAMRYYATGRFTGKIVLTM